MQSSNKTQTVFAVLFFVVFGIVFFRPHEAVQQALTFRYRPIPGEITQLEEDQDEEIEHIEFSYAYEGQRYFTTTPSYYSPHLRSDIEDEIGILRRGMAITAYVNPRDPSQAVLVRGMTGMMQFGLAWCTLVAIGALAAVISVFHPSRSETEWRHRFNTITDSSSAEFALRLVPGGMKNPRTVAIACFFTTFLLLFGFIELQRLMSRAMDAPDGFLVSLPLWLRLAGPFALAIGAATFDYFYTRNGNEHGRWDLKVNHETREVQVPAISAWGKSTTVRIEDIVGLELRTLISAMESDNNEATYRLNVLCDSIGDTTKSLKTSRIAYAVAQSNDAQKLRAMAGWLNDSAQLGLVLEESSCEGTFLSQMREITSSQRLVSAGS